MIKASLFLLVALGILGVLGGFRLRKRKTRRLAAGSCPRCGRPRIGKGPCGCGAPLGKG